VRSFLLHGEGKKHGSAGPTLFLATGRESFFHRDVIEMVLPVPGWAHQTVQYPRSGGFLSE